MTKEKIVLILFEKNKKDQDASFLRKWETLYSFGQKKGIIFCRAPISAYDASKKIFTKAQFFEDKWLFKKDVRPDLVYDKTPYSTQAELAAKRKKIEKALPFYNALGLSQILSDKWLTYKNFPEFSPKAVLIKSNRDLDKLKKLKSERLIFKPQVGSGGKGIMIFKKDSYTIPAFPFFAQELIEVKKGVKNFVAGPHDLRIMIANEKIFYAYLRIPKKGRLISNLSQGGTIRVVGLEKLPKNIFRFVKKIQSQLKNFKKKLYSVDLILDEHGKPWIIEMNSRPGLILAKEEEAFQEYFLENIINFFKKIK